VQVVLAYASIWSESDGARIEELVAESLTHDARILGPGYEFSGHAAIIAEAKRFSREQRGVRAVPTSGIDGHHDTARFSIAMVAPDGTVLHRGEDIVFFAPSGHIHQVLTYWGDLPPVPEAWPGRLAPGQ
jgi:hypothetical protein